MNPIVYYVPIPHIISGGVQIICKHVELLNEMGIKAYVHYETNVIPRWFEHKTPVLDTTEIGKLINYTIVIPEIVPEQIMRFVNSTRKILFAQNWKMMITNMNRIQKLSYIELGYTDIMTCGSAMTQEALKTGFTSGLKTYTVTNAASLSYESPLHSYEKVHNSILLLPRRNPNHVHALCDHLNKQKIKTQIRIIDNVPQSDLLAEFSKADIYVHTGDNEGLPRPPMEAMLYKCAVVGYDGRGGKDFMIDRETALVAENGSFDDLVKNVMILLEDTNLREKIRINGHKYLIQNFTLDRMKAELLQVYSS